jgi:hypothetical protein
VGTARGDESGAAVAATSLEAKSEERRVGNMEQETSAKLANAHNQLSDVYNWFTEGFETKDLQEAQGLLAELAGE